MRQFCCDKVSSWDRLYECSLLDYDHSKEDRVLTCLVRFSILKNAQEPEARFYYLGIRDRLQASSRVLNYWVFDTKALPIPTAMEEPIKWVVSRKFVLEASYFDDFRVYGTRYIRSITQVDQLFGWTLCASIPQSKLIYSDYYTMRFNLVIGLNHPLPVLPTIIHRELYLNERFGATCMRCVQTMKIIYDFPHYGESQSPELIMWKSKFDCELKEYHYSEERQFLTCILRTATKLKSKSLFTSLELLQMQAEVQTLIPSHLVWVTNAGGHEGIQFHLLVSDGKTGQNHYIKGPLDVQQHSMTDESHIRVDGCNLDGLRMVSQPTKLSICGREDVQLGRLAGDLMFKQVVCFYHPGD
ncbi:hypothetical protein X801_01546, partial [Opisthorchis viverrini]